MITINATGDTTIHTANKYCSEDILVKVPAGGSSGDTEAEYNCEVSFNIIGTVCYSFDSLINGGPKYGIYAPFNTSLSIVAKKGSLFHASIGGKSFDAISTSGDIELLANDAYGGATLRINGSGTITFTE